MFIAFIELGFFGLCIPNFWMFLYGLYFFMFKKAGLPSIKQFGLLVFPEVIFTISTGILFFIGMPNLPKTLIISVMFLPTILPVIFQLSDTIDRSVRMTKDAKHEPSRCYQPWALKFRRYGAPFLYGLSFILATVQLILLTLSPTEVAIVVIFLPLLSGVNWVNFSIPSRWNWFRKLSVTARGIPGETKSGYPKNVTLSFMTCYMFIAMINIILFYVTYMLAVVYNDIKPNIHRTGDCIDYSFGTFTGIWHSLEQFDLWVIIWGLS